MALGVGILRSFLEAGNRVSDPEWGIGAFDNNGEKANPDQVEPIFVIVLFW